MAKLKDFITGLCVVVVIGGAICSILAFSEIRDTNRNVKYDLCWSQFNGVQSDIKDCMDK